MPKQRLIQEKGVPTYYFFNLIAKKCLTIKLQNVDMSIPREENMKPDCKVPFEMSE